MPEPFFDRQRVSTLGDQERGARVAQIVESELRWQSGRVDRRAERSPIYLAGLAVAFIDWDLAAPGSRVWDIAYGLEDRTSVLEVVRQRQHVVDDTLRTWGEAGFDRMWAEDHGNGPLRDIDYLDTYRDHLDTFLEL